MSLCPFRGVAPQIILQHRRNKNERDVDLGWDWLLFADHFRFPLSLTFVVSALSMMNGHPSGQKTVLFGERERKSQKTIAYSYSTRTIERRQPLTDEPTDLRPQMIDG